MTKKILISESLDSVQPNTNDIYKKWEISIYLSPEDITEFKHFYNKLSSLRGDKDGVRYSILTRVCFINKASDSLDDVTEWRSLDDQISITYNDQFEISVFNYFQVIHDRLSYCMEKYDFKYHALQGVQMLIYRVYYTNVVKPKKRINFNSLGDNKDLINLSKIKKSFDSLPLTLNTDNFGEKLVKHVNDNTVEHITLKDGSKISFVDRINEHLDGVKKVLNMPKNTEFYQNSNYITTVETVKDVDDNYKNLINVHDINGMKIQKMVDKRLDKERFTRQIGNVKAFVNNKGVYNKIVSHIFDFVYPSKISGYFSKLTYSDNRIGSLDLETYRDRFNISKTYAIGFYVRDDLNMFYIDKDLNSDILIMKCLDAMLCEKYNRYTFYVHNLGRFDSVFLLRVIINATILNPNVYKVKLITRDETILSIKLSKKIGAKTYNIKIVDSYNFLTSKLSKLSETFNCVVKKGVFPYNFVSDDTLFYEGSKPQFNLYNNIDKTFYNSIPNNNWSTEKETLEYLSKDLIALFDIMDTFKLRIYSNYYTHITRSLTISGLAMDIFLRRFYNSNIPLINKKSVYNDIKNSYYGGITEVYKPYGRNLYYYDVNSLYPNSALKPMPGLNCQYIDNINTDISIDIDNMFGFYYCSIQAPGIYLGLLPVRTKSGILMPQGKFEGWYFSEELKFAHENGYKITVLKGYKFDKIENVFTDYVKEFYTQKCEAKDGIERSIAKSLLNNLLGRFGMDINRSITELVSDSEYNEIIQSRQIKSVKHIGNMKLVTYGSNISQNICENHNVDFKETFNNNIKNYKKSGISQSEDRLRDVSIAIASAVTSYSRIYMSQTKLDIVSKGSIYYTDTDSIVTDVKLDDKFVGLDIGKFKLEHEVKEGYFISNKTYCIKDINNKVISRTKGVDEKSLTFEDFEMLYKGSDISDVTRTESIKNYGEGFVNINKNKITISAKSYTKRDKIYKDNLWVDTKPLILI